MRCALLSATLVVMAAPAMAGVLQVERDAILRDYMADRAERARRGASVAQGVVGRVQLARHGRCQGQPVPDPLGRSACGSGVHRVIQRGANRGGTHDFDRHHPAYQRHCTACGLRGATRHGA